MRREAESVLQRWARRKRASQRPGLPAPHEPEDAVAAASPPEPAPRLEDLTAESDLAAFLQKGVPDALRNAALRKMWSLDPAIRDHVGLAECMWDFNRPESIPGFGPLAKTAAPAFLSQRTAADPAALDAAPSSLRRPDLETKRVGAHAPAEEPEPAPPAEEAAADPPAAVRRTAAWRHGSALPRAGAGG